MKRFSLALAFIGMHVRWPRAGKSPTQGDLYRRSYPVRLTSHGLIPAPTRWGDDSAMTVHVIFPLGHPLRRSGSSGSSGGEKPSGTGKRAACKGGPA